MLPTIEEIRSDFERCSRLTQKTVLVSIGGMLVLVFLSLGAAELFKASLGPVTLRFVPPAFFLAGVPLMIYGLWRADQHHKQFPNLRCRFCTKPFYQLSQIVIASHNCPNCGRQVVAVPDDVG